MRNKAARVAAWIAAVLAALTAVGLIAAVVSGGKLQEIFNLRALFETSTEVPVPTEPVPTTSPYVPLPTDPPSVSPTETLPDESQAPHVTTVLKVGLNDFEGHFSPLTAKTDGDQAVVRLTQLNLLTRDRVGNAVFNAKSGQTVSYNGSDYTYTGLADITSIYDKGSDITTYTVSIRSDIVFADGVPMTIDDVIFNYYLRLQQNYDGNGNIRIYNIVGLLNYYYNNSLAESLSISAEELERELADPSRDVADYIRNLIRSTLEAESERCEKIWRNYQSYGYGDSAQEFFYKLYGLSINYNLVGKNMEQVCNDVIDAYGLDYHKLAYNYAVDETYFDAQINEFVRAKLLYEKLQSGEGQPVDYISGIVRVGEYSMKLLVYGYKEDAIYDLFDVDILPLHIYGDADKYNYSEHRFGILKNYAERHTQLEGAPVGAGPYTVLSYTEDEVMLRPNPSYYGKAPESDFLVLCKLDKDPVLAIRDGDVDIVAADGSYTLYQQICSANAGTLTDPNTAESAAEEDPYMPVEIANGDLKGSEIYAVDYSIMGYSYIGINAEKVCVNGDPSSIASKALRKALLTAIAPFRESTYEIYFGPSATVIDYPMATIFGYAPSTRDADYVPAYSVNAQGDVIYDRDMDFMVMYNSVLDNVRSYLLQAGYKYDSTSGKFTEAPQGASLRYEIMLCGDEFHTPPSYEAIAYAKAVMYALGLTLNIRYIASEQEMLVSLYMGDPEMWCATWYTPNGPDFETHYLSEGRDADQTPNVFGIHDAALDALILKIRPENNRAQRTQLYRQAMAMIADWAIELPCYQLNNYILYSSKRIDTSSISADHSYYWTWISDIADIRVIPPATE